MKLYYKAGSCSLAPHIVMAELNMVYELEAVDLATKMMASGGNFREINPKGSVPAIRMDNGEILSEGVVISQYLADQKADSGLLPKFGTLERYRCLEWMNYIATEMHKGLGVLFAADRMMTSDTGKAEFKASHIAAMEPKLKFISEKLGSGEYLMGKQFTIADAYLFTVMSWTPYLGVETSGWSNLTEWMKRVAARPGVMKAMKEEGLIK